MKQVSTMSIIAAVRASIVFGLIALGACLLGSSQSAAQAEPDPTAVLGIDVDPSGNTATSLGTIDQCISVSSEADFDIDVFLDEIPSPHNLGGFEYRLNYDSTVIRVNAIDHGAGTSLIMSQAGSSVLDLGDCSPPGSPCPDTDGSLFVSVVDTGGPASVEDPDSLGVLGRYNLTVIGGEGNLTSLTLTDVTLAGFEPDVTLWPVDQVWDGDFAPAHGVIAIDTPCRELAATPAPTATVPAAATPAALTPAAPTPAISATATPVVPTPTEGEESKSGPGDMPWIAVYAAVGAVVVLLVGGLALSRARRR